MLPKSRKKIYAAFITGVVLSISVVAQNDFYITNLREGKIIFNPSYTGLTNDINAFILAREQWVGYEAAPSTQTIAFDTYLSRIKSGVGFTVVNDMLGNERSLRFKLNYAFRINFSRTTSFSFGAAGGMINKTFNAIDLVYEEFDPNAAVSTVGAYMPDFLFGVNFDHKLFNIGFSLSKTLSSTNEEIIIDDPSYLHIFMDYKYNFSDNLVLIPSVYMHQSDNFLSVDAGVQTILNKNITAGVAYRLGDAILGLVAYRINDLVKVGYSYDFPLSTINDFSIGTHEIYITLSVKKPEKEYFYYKSPRFF